MEHFRVVVTHPVFPDTAAMLAQYCVVEQNETLEPWTGDEVQRRCADADGLLAFMTDRVDAAFLSACPRLRAVSCALKGWDNFDVDACTRAGIWLTAVPDLLTEPTAELAVGLALALGRNILHGDALVRRGGFTGWRAQFYGAGLAGSTVGIAGAGRVGRAVARRLAGFGVARLLYFDAAALTPDVERALGLKRASWAGVLQESDVLFIALPLTADTRHMLGGQALEQVKPGCRVINAGRGSVVDEASVALALASGRLGGYAADVFEFEDWALPGRPDVVAPGLLHSTRTVFTPHLGSAVVEVRQAIELAAARNLLDALAGREPPDALNRPIINRPGR